MVWGLGIGGLARAVVVRGRGAGAGRVRAGGGGRGGAESDRGGREGTGRAGLVGDVREPECDIEEPFGCVHEAWTFVTDGLGGGRGSERFGGSAQFVLT